MAKYGDRVPRLRPPDYRARRDELQIDNPIICEPAVLAEGYGLWVRCGCGKKFEYLRDQVQCPSCTRPFSSRISKDMVGSESYGGV